MRGADHPTRPRRWIAGLTALLLAGGLLAIPVGGAAAGDPPDMVLQWNANAVAVLGAQTTADPPGLGQGPPTSAFHLAMVQGAVYDAVASIDRSHEHYLDGIPNAPATASTAAAVAQAAHDVLVGLTPSTLPAVKTRIDAMLAASLSGIPDSASRTAGIGAGQAAAAAMLTARTGDGRFGSATWVPGSAPSEWQPVPPGNGNVFAWAGDVTPFMIETSGQFRTPGPDPLTSRAYARDFNEVKAKGRLTGSTRTAKEDLLASFVSANPVPFMNKGFRDIATAQGLRTSDQARFFALTSMSGADALIGCFDDKAYWSFWRPQTAIVMAADDGNPATSPDPDWTSLYPVPGYTEHPSGYNCYTGAMMHAARLFYGTNKMRFELTSPGTAPIPGSTRTYHRFTDVIRDTIDGRILTGFHFRNGDVDGANLGKHVAIWANEHFFTPVH